MLKQIAMAATCVAACSTFPAQADTSAKGLTWGATYARQCYLAAKANPVLSDQQECFAALERESLSHFTHSATLVNRGVIRMHKRQYRAALADFDAAIATSPELGEAHLNKAIVLMATNATAEARALFDAAIRLKTSELQQAYYGRAVANELAGELAKAYADYREASRLAPEWQLPRDQLARFSVRGPRT